MSARADFLGRTTTPDHRSGRSGWRRRSFQLHLETLEDRTLPASAWHLDFGLPGSAVADGYTAVNVEAYSAAKGYGWKTIAGLAAVDRQTSDPLTCDFHRGTTGQLWVDVPSGVYDVTFTLGDPLKVRDLVELRAEGQVLDTGLTTAAGDTLTRTYRVTVADGRLNLRLIDNGGSNAQFALNGIDVVPVDSDFVITPFDTIPNFGKTPTITTAQSGPWSDVATWSLGRLPEAGDVVTVEPGHTVTYDVISDARLKSLVVENGGHLVFRTDVSTRLTVVNLLVLEGGELQIGTAANPVPGTVKAEIIFGNQALDTTDDPAQYGNGLVALGTVTMHGAVKPPFLRLANQPLAGDTTLSLAERATGWKVGDRLTLPDSKHWAIESEAYVPEYEDATIAGFADNRMTVILTSPLLYNHPGARDGDGVLEFLPHVLNRSRNVVVRSESAAGVRGHVMFTYRANVDVRYVQFSGGGRTRIDPIDNTTFDAAGNPTHIGTNQDERFPINFHHLYGPVTPPAGGHQYTFVGNAVFCPMPDHQFKWGITVQDSHYGLIKDNVLYNWAGAGLVTRDGNESFNVIEHNIAVRGIGEGDRAGSGRPGDEGTSFWFRGPNNYVRDNVAANYKGAQAEAAYGYKLYFVYLGDVHVPKFPGADLSKSANYTVEPGNAMPFREFARNEVYGVENGLSIWWLNSVDTDPQDGGNSVIKDFVGWHISRYGFYGYPMNDVTFDGYTIRGDKDVLSNRHEFLMGMWFGDYSTRNTVIRNADIQGMRTGIIDPYFGGATTIIEDSYLRNGTNIVVQSLGAPGSSPNGAWRDPKHLIIRNVRFGSTAGWNLGGVTPYNIAMEYTFHNGSANLIQTDTVFIEDYNGNPGENYRLYYREQKADFIVPKSDGNLVGSPEAGLTNQQNWTKYGIAIAGAIAPAGASERSDIYGLVEAM